MRAMILAAGLGTRLKPFTDKHPKALAVVNGKTVLQRNVEFLQQHGIFEVIVNVHHFADQVEEAIAAAKGWGSSITISNERDAVLETGGGILKAAPFLQQSAHFVVLNADILTNLNLTDMVQQHMASQAMGTLAVTERVGSRALLFDPQMHLTGWQHLGTGALKGRAGQPFAFSGVQVLQSGIFEHIPFTGKFSMIDVYLHLCAQCTFAGYNHTGSLFADIGTPEKLQAAAAMFP